MLRSLDRKILKCGYPERLVFVQSITDEEGNTIRGPFNENWPLEFFDIITFQEDGEKTILKMQGGPFNATVEEEKAFEMMLPMIKQGLDGTFKTEMFLAGGYCFAQIKCARLVSQSDARFLS